MPELIAFFAGLTAAGILTALFRALGGSRTVDPTPQSILDRLQAVEDRETARQIAFTEVQEQVYRHLKRVQALKQHSGNSPSTETERQASINAAIRARRASRTQPMLPNLNGEGD